MGLFALRHIAWWGVLDGGLSIGRRRGSLQPGVVDIEAGLLFIGR